MSTIPQSPPFAGATLMKVVWPARQTNPLAWLARNVALATVFSLLIGLCAHVSFRLPFTPVPVTLQTFAVLLTGALLGPRLGTATLCLYILEGLAGLPVFAQVQGSLANGYLAGFVVAAGVVGYLAERGWDRTPLGMVATMVIGSLIIYFFGVVWLSHFVGGVGPAVVEGVFPFLLGDALKAALAAALLPAGWKLLGTSRG